MTAAPNGKTARRVRIRNRSHEQAGSRLSDHLVRCTSSLSVAPPVWRIREPISERRSGSATSSQLTATVGLLGMRAFQLAFAMLVHNLNRCKRSVFHLQKVLGHSSLEMTRRYANLMTEDLQKIHQQVSLLSPR